MIGTNREGGGYGIYRRNDGHWSTVWATLTQDTNGFRKTHWTLGFTNNRFGIYSYARATWYSGRPRCADKLTLENDGWLALRCNRGNRIGWRVGGGRRPRPKRHHSPVRTPRRPHWRTLFSRGRYGNHGNRGAFMRTWRAAVKHSARGSVPIVRRQCDDCGRSHKDIYFKRRTNPYHFDLWSQMLITWSSRGNRFHRDFDIFSSFSDALHDRNPWRACNYNDYRWKIGFPRDCGAARLVPW